MSKITPCAPLEEETKFWLDAAALDYYLKAYVMAKRLCDIEEMTRRRAAIERAGYILKDLRNGARWLKPDVSEES